MVEIRTIVICLFVSLLHQMKCSGVWPSGTAFVYMENVMVPVNHLIGIYDKLEHADLSV